MERPPIGHRRLEVAAFTSSFVLYPYPRPTPRVSRFGSEDPFHLSAPAPRCALGLPVAGRPRAQRAEHPRARSCPGAIPSPAACGPRSSCASPGGSGLRPARGTGQPLGGVTAPRGGAAGGGGGARRGGRRAPGEGSPPPPPPPRGSSGPSRAAERAAGGGEARRREARGARAGGVRPGRQRLRSGGRRERRRQRAASGRARRGRRPGTRAAALRPRRVAGCKVSAAGELGAGAANLGHSAELERSGSRGGARRGRGQGTGALCAPPVPSAPPRPGPMAARCRHLPTPHLPSADPRPPSGGWGGGAAKSARGRGRGLGGRGLGVGFLGPETPGRARSARPACRRRAWSRDGTVWWPRTLEWRSPRRIASDRRAPARRRGRPSTAGRTYVFIGTVYDPAQSCCHIA